MTLSYGDVTRYGYGFSSVLRAIERLILMRSPTLPNNYPANFQGITRALWDLGAVLGGDIPPPASSSIGTVPPNWDAETNDYLPGGQPSDGSFWFDERQGRLFISKDGEWHQTNGGECFVHLGDTPPSRETPGVMWFDTRQGVGLVYIDDVTSSGKAGWYQFNGGGAGATLMDVIDGGAAATVYGTGDGIDGGSAATVFSGGLTHYIDGGFA